jgi:hypothetical protein
MCAAKRHVRFAPNSDRESGHVQCNGGCPLKAKRAHLQWTNLTGPVGRGYLVSVRTRV